MATTTSDSMDLYQRPPPHYNRQPSEKDSSPPPSPTYAAQPAVPPMDVDPRLARYQEITPTSPTLPPTEFSSSSATVNSRPNHSGRQVTPPSPPNSFLLHEADAHSPVSMDGKTGTTRPPPTVGPTPPASIKQRLTRVFGRNRGVSDATSVSTRRHKKNQGSSSTNATGHHMMYIDSNRSSIQPDAQSRGSLGAEDAPKLAIRSRHNSDVHQSSIPNIPPKRLVMNGGEVRVEIRRPQSPGHNRESDTQHYEYYARSNSPTSNHPEHEPEIYPHDLDDYDFEDQEDLMSPPLAPVDGMDLGSVHRHHLEPEPELHTPSANYQGFHFGLSHPPTPEPPRTPVEQPFAGFASTRPAYIMDPPSSSGFSSGKASSTALARNESYDKSLSSAFSRSNSQQTGRPGFNRDPSFNNSLPQIPVRTGSAHESDEVARDVKRLSKISAGSGISGVAILVTTDGAGDMQAPEQSPDQFGTRQWTREEKGKSRADSAAVLSGTGEQSSRTDRRQGHSEDRQDSSTGSAWTGGKGNLMETTEEDGDSTSLLPSGSEIVHSRKLRAQEAGKDILVHRGNPAYDFSYRMRQTSGDEPILVPHYRYEASSTFPNRNALTRPIPAKPTTADSTKSSISANSIPGSLLRKPPSAILRNSAAMESYATIPQGDQAYDISDIHPAFRRSTDNDSEYAASNCHLDAFGGSFRAVATAPDGSNIYITRPDPGTPSIQRLSFTDLPSPEPSRRRSWSPAKYLPVPSRRPAKFLRRSLTPHLYSPQDIALESMGEKERTESQQQSSHSIRRRERQIGRMLMLMCVIFPPLLFILASGGFDSFVASWTKGEIHRIGRTEKRLSLILGTLLMIVVVVAVVAGVSVAITAG